MAETTRVCKRIVVGRSVVSRSDKKSAEQWRRRRGTAQLLAMLPPIWTHRFRHRSEWRHFHRHGVTMPGPSRSMRRRMSANKSRGRSDERRGRRPIAQRRICRALRRRRLPEAAQRLFKARLHIAVPPNTRQLGGIRDNDIGVAAGGVRGKATRAVPGGGSTGLRTRAAGEVAVGCGGAVLRPAAVTPVGLKAHIVDDSLEFLHRPEHVDE